MTGEGGQEKAGQASARDQAAHWFAVLRGPNADREQAGFEEWLGASELNRKAFAEVSAIFAGAGVLKTSAIYRTRKPQGMVRPARIWRPAALAASIGLALLVGVMWTQLRPWQQAAAPAPGQTFTTRPGAMQDVALDGGAMLALDSATEVRLEQRYNGSVVTLVRGRVRLTLDHTSPAIVVRVGNSEIASSHGKFDVSWTDERDPQVQLYEGQARAQPFLQRAAVLTGGNAIPVGRPVRLTRAGIEILDLRYGVDERDWPEGWAQYRSIPLSELARRANRYASRPIVIADPAIGDLRVSGRFRLGNADVIARSMAHVFGLEVTDRSDGIYLEQP